MYKFIFSFNTVCHCYLVVNALFSQHKDECFIECGLYGE